MERSETIRRVDQQLQRIHSGIRRPVNQETVQEYHEQLNRLEALGLPVDDFRVPEDDWSLNRLSDTPGKIATYNGGALRGDEELVVSQSKFRRRMLPAIDYVQRLIRDDEAQRMAQASDEQDAIFNERNQVLSTFIDAYLKNQKSVPGDGIRQ